MGDAGRADQSLPSPFGNRHRYPYWTGRSFDRCTLLALVYPLLSLFAVWVWTGEDGELVRFLGLMPESDGWHRGPVMAALSFEFFSFWRGLRAEGWRQIGWLAVGGAGAFAVAGAGTAAVTGADAAVAFAIAIPIASTVAIAIASTIAIAVAVAVDFSAGSAGQRGRLLIFWATFLPLALAGAYSGLWRPRPARAPNSCGHSWSCWVSFP